MGNDRPEIGIIGLGKMGGNLALQATEKGIHVVGYDLNGLTEEQSQAGVEDAYGLPGFYDKLGRPRILFIYIPAGPLVDQVIDELSEYLDQGDIIVEGGNAYWGDSIRRQRRLKEQGIHFIDLGTSGGIGGARHGACFMAGGEPEPVAHVEPVLRELAVEGGYVHAGPPGAGHFVKLVHNGIEFGMLQAIAEGMDLLEAHRDRLPIADILHCWRHGSVIRSWFIELMEQTYRDKGGLEAIPPYVEDTGEVNWLVDDALHMEVAVPVIAQSVMQLLASRDKEKRWALAIALMRHGFGSHPFGADEAIAQERKQGRVGGFFAGETDQ